MDEGRKDERRGGVVLLHGHGRTGASMQLLALHLRAAGYVTKAPSYGFGRALPAILDLLEPRVARFQEGLSGPMHIVTHSLGGLVARALIARRRPERLGRVVMLAPPNGGSELADTLARWHLAAGILGPVAPVLCTDRPARDAALLGEVDYPLGVIAGDRGSVLIPPEILPRPHDGKVTVAATRVAGMADHIVLPVGHTTIMLNAGAIAQTLAFLARGAFDRERGSQQ